MNTEVRRRTLLTSFVGGLATPTLMAFGGAARAQSAGRSYLMMVFNNSVEGQDDEYNTWYDNVHGPEVTQFLNFDHFQRFGAAPINMGGRAPRPYVILYSGRSAHPARTYAGYFINAAKAPPGPRLIRPGTNYNDSLEPVGPEIKGAGASGQNAQSYLWFVYADAVAGRQDPFRRWFEGDFARSLAQTPGVVSAQPYVRTEAQLGTNHGDPPPPPHLVLFRIRTGDLDATMNTLNDKRAALRSDAADPTRWLTYGYRELGPAKRPS